MMTDAGPPAAYNAALPAATPSSTGSTESASEQQPAHQSEQAAPQEAADVTLADCGGFISPPIVMSHTHAQLSAVVHAAQEVLTADIARKTRSGNVHVTKATVRLRIGGAAFYSSKEFSAGQVFGEDDSRKRKLDSASGGGGGGGGGGGSAVGDEAEEALWVARHGGLQLVQDTKTLDSVHALWVHETCAQISPQVYMDDDGHYYKVHIYTIHHTYIIM